MELTDTLEKLGLHAKEASVYLAALELGVASVESIAKKAGTKRPTTYLVLDDLQTRGLVSLVPRARKTLYTAESPELILTEINRKEELLKRFMPNLLAVYNAKKEKPQVQLYEGKQGLRQVYDKIFSSPAIDFFSTIRDVFAMFPDMPKLLRERVITKQTKVREILTQTPADIEYVSWIKQHEYYQSRFAPKSFPEFLTDSAIYGNHVAFFSFKPAVFAVQIESREVSQSLRILFDMAWMAGVPYEKVIKS
ncbi:MAG: hypothetical protein A2751_02130 [Candidatus Doudnabacteria bacterium RIFCSPHIGHO2_01_FULL_46_14]|uniref:Transcription regulator TrmB N-terminal domain-containing protein n=1 Tax=Candidatus Doudnabacteria bacterium RIFCSPHIGHO2_01_FULL_46_14 TaxID=1817824 RepID=A0A1F5NJV0_9BACT|nr:MAG: hypothetical protein A2751_02130 [Candidatus Doudnabacteria bacterium RIFCSPHIGHO2_01_FULL_46_14]